MIKDNNPLHITKAGQMLRDNRPGLLQLIFGKKIKYVDPIIPENLWDKYHSASHVMMDGRTKPINIFDYGLRYGVLTKEIKPQLTI